MAWKGVEGCNTCRSNTLSLEILSVFWLIKTHPQWKREVKSTMCSLTLVNVWASVGLAHESIIYWPKPNNKRPGLPPKHGQWLTGEWHQRCQRKIPDEAPAMWASPPAAVGQSGKRGAGQLFRGTGLIGSHGLWKNEPTPLVSEE